MSVHHESAEASHGTAQPFNDVLSPLAFRPPEMVPPSAWIEHIPFGFWLVERATPRRIVELGTGTGTSYLAFCQAVQVLGLTTQCYAVDTWQGDAHSGSYGEDVYQTLLDYHDRRYASFSRLVRSTFDQALDHFEDSSIDLIHIDGLHTYEAVRHDFERWRPKLSSRGIALFHDTNVRERGFGVFKLWTEIAEIYPDSFEFLHCHGLGVLGVGAELPAALRKFFVIARSAEGKRLIRDVYSRLGLQCWTPMIRQQYREALAAQSNTDLLETS